MDYVSISIGDIHVSLPLADSTKRVVHQLTSDDGCKTYTVTVTVKNVWDNLAIPELVERPNLDPEESEIDEEEEPEIGAPYPHDPMTSGS